MTRLATDLTSICLSALGQEPPPQNALRFTGVGSLQSAFPVTELASACHAAVGCALTRLIDPEDEQAIAVSVDRRLASVWFQESIKPIGWEIPGPWDSIAGDYLCRDGWIRLHTNAPMHRAAAQQVLGAHNDKITMAKAVLSWSTDELEETIVSVGGCAARMRSTTEWAEHPQGSAVKQEPLIDLQEHQASPDLAGALPMAPERPLDGIKVLDLTRVLAGPVATRILAGYGAQVLRLDPPVWDEPGVVPSVTIGKRCARLDLRSSTGRALFVKLLSQADVLVHGYRYGALDGLGLDAASRRAISPGLIDVSLNAYGWHGPWSGRRGFDSLVQMSSGIAHAGMQWRGRESPVPLPAQALDHATGWLMAASAIRGLARRRHSGVPVTARLSLARTAALLVDHAENGADADIEPIGEADYSPETEHTTWGPAKRLKPALSVASAPMQWSTGAVALGTHSAEWL